MYLPFIVRSLKIYRKSKSNKIIFKVPGKEGTVGHFSGKKKFKSLKNFFRAQKNIQSDCATVREYYDIICFLILYSGKKL